MAKIIRGGGEHHRKHGEEQYGGSHYQRNYIKDYQHDKIGGHPRVHERYAALSGGHHGNAKYYKMV